MGRYPSEVLRAAPPLGYTITTKAAVGRKKEEETMIITAKSKKKSESDQKPTGEPILKIEVNLKAIRAIEGDSLASKLRSAALQSGSAEVSLLLRSLAESIDGPEDTTAIESADTCHEVYWGCGSCGEGASRVDVYCNSSGGSDPDWWYCLGC